jgi:hypothetical protein
MKKLLMLLAATSIAILAIGCAPKEEAATTADTGTTTGSSTSTPTDTSDK